VQIDDLLRKRKIYRHRASAEEIERILELADRDIRMARLTMAEDCMGATLSILRIVAF